MIAHDFASRLAALDRWRRRIHARGYSIGFAHGVAVTIAGVLFFAWYFWTGSQS